MSDTLYLEGQQWETKDLLNNSHSYRVVGGRFQICRIEVHWSENWDQEYVDYPINGDVNISRYYKGVIQRAVLTFQEGELMSIQTLPNADFTLSPV
jgi:hypothetical protein